MMGLVGAGIGIDIGAQTIKIVAARPPRIGPRAASRGGRILGAASIEVADVGGGSPEPAQLAHAIAEAIRGLGVRPGAVALGVSGRDAITRYSRVPDVPDWRLKLMMRYEIEDVAAKVGEPLAAGWTILSTERIAGDEQTILVALAKEKPLGELLDALEGEGIRVALTTPIAMGLHWAHRALEEEGDGETVLLADLGAESVDIVVVRGRELAFARSASFGGRQFTEAVASALRLSREQAEALKVARGSVDASGQGPIGDALRGVAGQFASLLRSTIQFAKVQLGAQGFSCDRIELAGGGARLGGLPRYLADNLGIPCRLFDPISRIARAGLPAASEEVLSRAPGALVPALGLAIAAVHSAWVPLDLTPAAQRARRAFRSRTVPLIAAGGMLGVLLIIGAIGSIVGSAGARSQQAAVRSALEELQGIKGEHAQLLEESARVRARIDGLIEEVRPTEFTACLLAVLGRSEVPEMAIRNLALRRTDAVDGDGLRPNFAWAVEGLADDSNRKAVEHIDELRREIASNPRVAEVQLEAPPVEAGNAYRFTL
ncbi:MAG: pilus assembly protein PilM, partial [Planctomycetes bacterium]|nr:pilus assembly protein PilM [Planctomycetota bacterium]